MLTKRFVYLYRTIGAIVGLLVLGWSVPVRAQVGLGLLPMRAELKLSPGEQYSGSLKLSSQSGPKTRIRAEVLDFDVDEKATPQFERDLPQEAAYSCKKWLSLNPMEIELENGGFLNVRYTLHVPADVREGSYNCAAGFTTMPPVEQTTEGIGMRMAVRIVAALYVTVGSPPVVGKLKEIKLEPLPPAPPSAPRGAPEHKEAATPSQDSASPGGWRAVLVMENDGTMYYRPTGKLEVVDEAGKVQESAEIPSLPVLRQRDQRFLFPLKTKLEGGHYKLRARVDIGTGEIQEGSADVSVDAAPPAR